MLRNIFIKSLCACSLALKTGNGIHVNLCIYGTCTKCPFLTRMYTSFPVWNIGTDFIPVLWLIQWRLHRYTHTSTKWRCKKMMGRLTCRWSSAALPPVLRTFRELARFMLQPGQWTCKDKPTNENHSNQYKTYFLLLSTVLFHQCWSPNLQLSSRMVC